MPGMSDETFDREWPVIQDLRAQLIKVLRSGKYTESQVLTCMFILMEELFDGLIRHRQCDPEKLRAAEQQARGYIALELQTGRDAETDDSAPTTNMFGDELVKA